MVPPRLPIHYRHRYERDSFAALSPEGMAVLPPPARQELERDHNMHKSLSLRTTVDTDPKLQGQNPVIARILKIRLADLDIFCPTDPFDVRISVNIEIDFHGRDDIDPAILSLRPDEDDGGRRNGIKQEAEVRPDRMKDRLSYKHMAYSIDLTQVSTMEKGPGGETVLRKGHELEVEVDAAMLRSQAEKLQREEPNTFERLVEGLLNNVLVLSRVRA